MENKIETEVRVISEEDVTREIIFSENEERHCLRIIRSQLIKLLYLIEAEQAGGESIRPWFMGFMLDLSSSNTLCHEKLTKVIVKIYGLYTQEAYKAMPHAQIKRQIMESKGIVDHLLTELDKKIDVAVK